jgi:hypothetical protein
MPFHRTTEAAPDADGRAQLRALAVLAVSTTGIVPRSPEEHEVFDYLELKH